MSDKVSRADVQQMDRYMLRTWVEVMISLNDFTQSHSRSLAIRHADFQTSAWLRLWLCKR